MERAMGIEPTSATREAIECHGFPSLVAPTHVSHGTLHALSNRVAQVAQLSRGSEGVSGCSTVPYDIPCLVRNEEAEGSNPFSSTTNFLNWFDLRNPWYNVKFAKFANWGG
jgi:hypothetical protein